MARFIVEYLDDGSISNTLYFDGVGYNYIMEEDEEGYFIADSPSFEYQVQERFPDLYPEEVLDLLSEVCYHSNSYELQEIIMELSHYE